MLERDDIEGFAEQWEETNALLERIADLLTLAARSCQAPGCLKRVAVSDPDDGDWCEEHATKLRRLKALHMQENPTETSMGWANALELELGF